MVIFSDNTAGGRCSLENFPCVNEPNAVCKDGCCVCNDGYSKMGGSCVHGMRTDIDINILSRVNYHKGSDEGLRFRSVSADITKTYLYNVDPLKFQFDIVKLGFTGVYIILLISSQKHRLWVQRGDSIGYLQSMFEAEM